jgi:hypothetical protein
VAGAFDATLKQLLDTCAPDWVAWLAPLVGLPASVAVEPLDVDLSTVQPVADKVFRLRAPAAGLLHLEVQSSWDGAFPGRLLVYNVLLEDRYGGPVHTVALLLRREASAPGLTGTVLRTDATGREYLRFAYTVVRLWELPADALLSGGLGAAPLALLTDDAAPRLQESVDRFAGRVAQEVPGQADANRLLSCGYILMGLRYDEGVVQALFHGVQKMKESSTYQAIRNEGRDEGLLLARREALLGALQERFQTVPPEIEARIRAMTDLAKLQTAFRRAFHVNAPDELSLD